MKKKKKKNKGNNECLQNLRGILFTSLIYKHIYIYLPSIYADPIQSFNHTPTSYLLYLQRPTPPLSNGVKISAASVSMQVSPLFPTAQRNTECVHKRAPGSRSLWDGDDGSPFFCQNQRCNCSAGSEWGYRVKPLECHDILTSWFWLICPVPPTILRYWGHIHNNTSGMWSDLHGHGLPTTYLPPGNKQPYKKRGEAALYISQLCKRGDIIT